MAKTRRRHDKIVVKADSVGYCRKGAFELSVAANTQKRTAVYVDRKRKLKSDRKEWKREGWD